jgi:hypothetical protein
VTAAEAIHPTPGSTRSAKDQPVAIDDISSALAAMTQMGREALRQPARMVREAVMLYAARSGWKIISHEAFCDWARSQVDPDYLWLVLDPLLPVESLSVPCVRVRATRRPISNDWPIADEIPTAVKESMRGREIGILDDAAASGDTLRFLAGIITQQGGSLSDVVLCVSTAQACSAVREIAPGCSWAQMHSAPATPLHMRDGCPLLPYSGRRLGADRSLAVAGAELLMSVPPMYFRGGLWHELAQDRAAWSSIRQAWRLAGEGVSRELERKATVADIPLIGANVPVPLFMKNEADNTTELEWLLS